MLWSFVFSVILLNLSHTSSLSYIRKNGKIVWLRPEKPVLRFNSKGTFKILHLADLHYGEYDGTPLGIEDDINTTKVVTDILSWDQPDFVIFTGDFMTADSILINPVRFVDQLLAPLVAGGYKWASTYGNHDNGVAITREHIFAAESKYDALCYTQHGHPRLQGVTNYYLPIYAPEANETTSSPALVLWFFDSRGGFDPTGIKPYNVDASVVNWFRETNLKLLEKWGRVPALAYFHIPTVLYRDVQVDFPHGGECSGMNDEVVVPQDRESSLMTALLESGTVLTTFVGHDHGNDWCCKYHTLEICYNRHTGYGGYGEWIRGARLVELDLSRDIWTSRRNYVRLEDGTIVHEYPNPQQY